MNRSVLAGAGVMLGVQRPPQQQANCFIAARNFRLRSAPILNEYEDRPFELEPDGGSIFVHMAPRGGDHEMH
jgi:hypothetical protein